jgi:putative hydrolase of the HAD superfamily
VHDDGSVNANPACGPGGGRVLEGVGVDLDGTLMDHAASSDSAVRAWADQCGWPVTIAAAAWAEAEGKHFVQYTAGTITFQEQRRRRVRDTLVALGKEPHEHDLDDLFLEYLRYYESSWTAYPDAAPFLRAVRRAGLRIGVLTNGQREQQEAKLAAIGLRDAVDVVVASSDLTAGKPDSRAFEALCVALGTSPSDTPYIGDDLTNDVAGAAAAGLPALWLNRVGTPGDAKWPQVPSLDSALDWLGVASPKT